MSLKSFVWARFFGCCCCCCRIFRFWSTPKPNLTFYCLGCACVRVYALLLCCYRLCILISLKECLYMLCLCVCVFDFLLCQLFIRFLIALFSLSDMHTHVFGVTTDQIQFQHKLKTWTNFCFQEEIVILHLLTLRVDRWYLYPCRGYINMG